jgi:peroxiredoxin Q/BCP
LRADYPRFTAAGAEILAIAPHPLADVERYAARAGLPFPLLADPRRAVYRAYDVGRAVWSFGQRPGLYVIDRAGVVQYAVLGAQMWELPANDDVLAVLAALDGLEHAGRPAGDAGQAAIVATSGASEVARRRPDEADEGCLACAPASDWQL